MTRATSMASSGQGVPSASTSPCVDATARSVIDQAGFKVGLQHSQDWREDVYSQICKITGELFRAAVQNNAIHFQPLPNAFELFGLDYLVDADGTAWLLEVNAFPDFKQTGEDLQEIVAGLFEEVVQLAIKPFFGIVDKCSADIERSTLVLDLDVGRR